MSQPVAWDKPKTHTPLHILCNGSDAKFQKLDIVKTLLDNDIVHHTAFATLRTDKVTVCFPFLWAPFSETANPSGKKWPEGQGQGRRGRADKLVLMCGYQGLACPSACRGVEWITHK